MTDPHAHKPIFQMSAVLLQTFQRSTDKWLLKKLRTTGRLCLTNQKLGALRTLADERKTTMPDDKSKFVIVVPFGQGYTVSCLQAFNPPTLDDTSSYVEVVVAPSHPLHPVLVEKTTMLSMAGDKSQIDGIGECYSPGVFSVLLDEDQVSSLMLLTPIKERP